MCVAHARANYKVKSGTAAWEKAGYGTTPVIFLPFIFADLWQFKVLWLIWSVP